MNTLSKCTIIISIFCFASHTYAQDFEENCELGERYYELGQRSLNIDREDAIGWLDRATTVCPRYEYFRELGVLWAQSTEDYLLMSAADVFVRARARAETNTQKIEILIHHARLLARMDDPQYAQDLVTEALQLDRNSAELDRNSAELNRLAKEISEQLSSSRQPDVTRDEPLSNKIYPWPPEEPSKELRITNQVIDYIKPGMKFYEVEDIFRDALQFGDESGKYKYGFAFYAIPATPPEGCPTDADYDAPADSEPSGFVIATVPERTDSNWVPLDPPDRHVSLEDVREGFSFGRALSSLFFTPGEDYSRFIAFVVYDKPYRPRDCPMSYLTAKDRVDGDNWLSDKLRNQDYTKQHYVDALIYEYQLKEVEDSDPIVEQREANTGTEAAQHIENIRLYGALKRASQEIVR